MFIKLSSINNLMLFNKKTKDIESVSLRFIPKF